MNYMGLIHYQIVARIRHYAEVNGFSNTYLADASGIDRGDFSRILKLKKKYLLSAKDAKGISNVMDIPVDKLIWGNDVERESLIKLILVSALTNGSKTAPVYFFDNQKELFQWALTQDCLPRKLRNYIFTALAVLDEHPSASDDIGIYPASEGGNISSASGKSLPLKKVYNAVSFFFHQMYGSFYDEENAFLFSLLGNQRDSALDLLSHELLFQLLGDYQFAQRYTERLVNSFENNVSGSFNERKLAFTKLITGGSNSGDMIIDWGGPGFCYFVEAFNKLWDKHKSEYMSYFHGTLFSSQEIEQHGLKALSNLGIKSLITSSSFLKIVHTQTEMDEYTSDEVFTARNYFRFAMQRELRKQRLICDGTDNLIETLSFDYANDLMNLTHKYAPLLMNQKR